MRSRSALLTRTTFGATIALAVGLAGCGGETPTSPLALQDGLGNSTDWISETTGAIAGVVFDDTDRDGRRDEGEAGLAGAVVQIAYPTGFTASATTDAEGQYVFDDLDPAYYIVTGPSIPDWTHTTAPTRSVRVAAATITPIDHGLYTDVVVVESGSVGGTVFGDADFDGVQDLGEWGLAGLTVEVVDADGTAHQATTDADGQYLVEDLVVGPCSVTAAQPDGWVATTSATVEAQVTDGTLADVDFGLAVEETDGGNGLAAIGGVVFEDLDADGMRDPGEPGLAGVRVRLSPVGPGADRSRAGDRGPHHLASTAADGSYAFDDLPPGTWRVFALPPRGHHPVAAPGLDISVQAGDMMEHADLGMMSRRNLDPAD